MKEQYDFDTLLEQYCSIWNNRLLTKLDKESEDVLFDAIRRELLDENTHPRVRKSKYEKYYTAARRVIESSVSIETKVLLIELHNHVMEKLRKESN